MFVAMNLKTVEMVSKAVVVRILTCIYGQVKSSLCGPMLRKIGTL